MANQVCIHVVGEMGMNVVDELVTCVYQCGSSVVYECGC